MLEKKYDHLKVEENKYSKWLDKKYFECDPKSGKNPYAMVLSFQKIEV